MPDLHELAEAEAAAEREKRELRDRLHELNETFPELLVELKQALQDGDADAARAAREALDANRGDRAEVRGKLDLPVGPLLREIAAETRLAEAAKLLPAELETLETREVEHRERFGENGFSDALAAVERHVEAIEDEAHGIAVQRAGVAVLGDMLELDVPEPADLPEIDRSALREAIQEMCARFDSKPFRANAAQLLEQARRGNEGAARKLAELAGGKVAELIEAELEARGLDRQLAAESEE